MIKQKTINYKKQQMITRRTYMLQLYLKYREKYKLVSFDLQLNYLGKGAICV